jgi:hypothetical protein
MGELLILMSFWASVVAQIFSLLDSAYLGDYSILDIHIAMEFVYITLSGIFHLLLPKYMAENS